MKKWKKQIEELFSKNSINFVLVKHFRDDKYLSVVFYRNGEIERNVYLKELSDAMNSLNLEYKKNYKEADLEEEYPGKLKKALIGNNWLERLELLIKEYENQKAKDPLSPWLLRHLSETYSLSKIKEIYQILEELGLETDQKAFSDYFAAEEFFERIKHH
ncbi:hypothetical protein HY837_00260 [archaeon]|nr:hypothetical protein [archaeon]